MPSPSLCVIHNPKAGRGGAVGRSWRRIQEALGASAEYRATTEPDHAAELAEEAARAGFRTVAAAGGDGTVHEVANGLLRAAQADCAFGVIPLGSGNDYARMLRLPKDPRRLAERLLSEEAWAVDAGRVTADGGRRERWFVNTAGFGLSGVVTYEASKITGLKGVPLYGLAALRAIRSSFRAIGTALRFDEELSPGPTLYLAIALGRAEGGGFVVAPNAELDDGWFDYVHAGPMSRLSALGYLPRMLLGKLPASRGPIRRGRCRRVIIEADEPLHCHTDGELFSQPGAEAKRFEVTLAPKALRLRGRKPGVA